ncbi:MAG: MFS transporter, partial [Actinomycetota bacterium]|nr:MFS transporter [Actinomycetota bacterium]
RAAFTSLGALPLVAAFGRRIAGEQAGGRSRLLSSLVERPRGLLADVVRAGAPPPSEALIWALGLGSFGLAWSISTVAVYLPSVLQRFTDADSLIGLTLAAEGLFALTLSLVVGPLSDATRSPLGRRRPYLVAALPPLAISLSFLGTLPSLPATAALLFLFFVAYYIYEPPYRSLYADVLPSGVMGRAQSAAHVLRGLAMAGALVSGGVALAAWRPLPFLVAAVVTLVACAFVPLHVSEAAPPVAPRRTLRAQLAASARVARRDDAVRRFFIANTAWEATFAGMRTFVVLYVVEGLDQSLQVASAVLATVTAGYLLAAVVLGPFVDQLGIGRVILVASVVYGLGLFAAGFATRWHDWYYALILPVAIAGGAVMALAWGLLFKLLGDHDLGAGVGLGIAARGLGLLIGPPLMGITVDAFRPILTSTDGYGAVWPAVAVPILAVIPLVARLARLERDQVLRTEPAP